VPSRELEYSLKSNGSDEECTGDFRDQALPRTNDEDHLR